MSQQWQSQNTGNWATWTTALFLQTCFEPGVRVTHKTVICVPATLHLTTSPTPRAERCRLGSKRREYITRLPFPCLFLASLSGILKARHSLLISSTEFESHMTKLLSKTTWIKLASITSSGKCWTKSKYISQEDKHPLLLRDTDMQLWFHLGVGGQPTET